ncbi:hypothetical protein V492_03241 [Pseudogymnoascus sp. VKM F-4246]|nr:hypothetical protein V492_03241 [Pseudogymnoascus sp. VKM F-4246]
MKFTTILVAATAVLSSAVLASPVEAESAAALAMTTAGTTCPALLTMTAASSERGAFFCASPLAAALNLRQHEALKYGC